jgi:hypothetical protein
MDPRWAEFFGSDHDQDWEDKHHISPDKPFLLTASKVADAMGVGYESAKRLYEYFTGVTEHVQKTNEYMEWGTLHEPVALKCLGEMYPHWAGIKPGMLRHPTHNWIASTSDKIFVDCDTRRLLDVEVHSLSLAGYVHSVVLFVAHHVEAGIHQHRFHRLDVRSRLFRYPVLLHHLLGPVGVFDEYRKTPGEIVHRVGDRHRCRLPVPLCSDRSQHLLAVKFAHVWLYTR